MEADRSLCEIVEVISSRSVKRNNVEMQRFDGESV